MLYVRKSIDHLSRLLAEDENSLIARTHGLAIKVEKLEEKDSQFIQTKTAVVSAVVSTVMGFLVFLIDHLTRSQK